ncbi:MAG: ABC transporter substrate-binding protein [Alphaproteobacteria bacterium]
MPFRSPAALVASLLLLAGAVLVSTGSAGAADFVDSAGRRVVLPDRIGRVMPAEPNAEVLVFVLAPERMVGQSRVGGRVAGRRAPRGNAARLSAVDWGSRSTPAGMAEAARRARPDLIVDAGAVTPDRSAFADQVTQLTGVPYILVDSSFARMPKVVRTLAMILDVERRRTHDLFMFAEHAIADLRGQMLIRPADARPRVYYARGPDGLTTALPGTPAGEAIDEAGAINVAGQLGRSAEVRVSRAQLLGWDPQIIIAENRGFYASLQRDPGWRHLAAVRNKRVYLEPSSPFGWIEDPAGVNRLIGLDWLSNLFYPDASQEDLRGAVCDFYDKFYRIKLTNAQMEAMVRPAGVPPVEVMRPVGEPLVGLGTLPASPPPPGTISDTKGGPKGAPGDNIAAPSIVPATSTAATCVIPGGPSPYLTSGVTNSEAAPAATVAPGVPPPGRRGRPVGLAPQ